VPWVVAVSALIGVTIGAFLNGFVARRLERIRDAQAAMVTARLVTDDLSYIRRSLAAHIIAKRIGNALPSWYPMETWNEQRALLAGALDLKDWETVSDAARVARRYIEIVTEEQNAVRSIPDGELRMYESMVHDLDVAGPVLIRLARGTQVPHFLPWRHRKSDPVENSGSKSGPAA
jgi:hypothetical protein